ncbi:MAG: TolC family protein, partial [Zoogloeaceae bacterium]|nr:TolC family protein [Zoogloeaceae bacterium]
MIKQPQKTRLALCLGVACLFSGCAIGPDFQRPENALPEKYGQVGTPNPNVVRSSATRCEGVWYADDDLPAACVTTTPVNPEWWTLFGDAELNRLMALALDNNQDLQAAIARMEAAQAAAREAGAEYYPNVDLEGSSIRNRTSAKTASGKQMGRMTSTNRRVALDISYELDLWGRIRRSNEAARAEALAGEFARDTVQIALASQLAAEYLTLRVL